MGLRRILRELTCALYLDVPYIVDSIWRRAEFNANRWFRYSIPEKRAAELHPRSFVSLPQYWLFVPVLVFVAYGPTFDSLCSILGVSGMARARAILGAAFLVLSLFLLMPLTEYAIERANKRLDKAGVPPCETVRRGVVHTLTHVGLYATVVPIGLIGFYLLEHADVPICHVVASAGPAYAQLLVTAVAVAISFTAGLRIQPAWRSIPFLGGILLALVVGILWGGVAAHDASEATQTPYPHVYGAFALAMVAIAALAPMWARFQFRKIVGSDDRKEFQEALTRTELFPPSGSRQDPSLSTGRIVAATAVGIYSHPLEFLLLPSLCLLFVPAHRVWETVLAGALASISLLTMGSLTARWRQMVFYVSRLFLMGSPLIVSIAVICLALLRVNRVQYVTTVLDVAPFGVMFSWVVMTYALSWWFEYAINTAAAVELLRLLGGDGDAKNGRVRYRPETGTPLKMPGEDRWIAAHGLGRFAALGRYLDEDTNKPGAAFQTFGLAQLFSLLARSTLKDQEGNAKAANPGGADDVPKPPDAGDKKETLKRGLGDRKDELVRRIQLYFVTLNALLALVAIAYFGYYGHGDRANTVNPIVEASQPPEPGKLSDLTSLLKGQAEKGRPAIVIAASGGGTRAAVFTATALRGLAKLGVGHDIVLLSGVSGGAVAAAYYYAHQDQLEDGKSDKEWDAYENHMTDPFIQDVLEGASEWRLVSKDALGTLLKESFDRQLFGGQERLGDATRPALILNTTVTGHPQEDSDLLRDMFLPARTGTPCDARHPPYALISGGRLIFTNLRDRMAFPRTGGEPVPLPDHDEEYLIPDVWLPYVVVQDPQVLLSAGAALSANFPPVFPNARVTVPSEVKDDACPVRSYYVTDGGAAENLGLVSALYALRQALTDLRKSDVKIIPDIHLVLMEASATTYDYTPDRGINAASGGSKERMTGGLTTELLREISQLRRAGVDNQPVAKLEIHDLALPLAFRSRGGFGTNWMFPDSIVIANPRTPRPAPWYGSLTGHQPSAVLTREDLISLWTELHDPCMSFCGDGPFKDPRNSETATVANWICGATGKLPPDTHVLQWQSLVTQLRGFGPPKQCSTEAAGIRH